MVQRSTVAWIAENRLLAAGVALFVIVAAVTFALLSGTDEDLSSRLTQPRAEREASGAAVGEEGEEATGAQTRAEGAAPSAPTEAPAAIPGLPGGPGAEACVAESVDEVGVDDETITIGQVVTDSNQIPQQLRPAHEGLQAFVNVFNSAGGLCGRRLELEYRNDNLNPATHNQDMQQLAGRVLAFVGNESLLDFLDYERRPPFRPTVRGGGSFVPDVGGLAFSYGRSQSAWHAGVVGSVSPVLVGGGQFKFFAEEVKARGTPCRTGGIVYLREPTGASEDQARVGQAAVEERWGAGLGRGNTELYAANLLDPVPAYEALVDRMVANGVNCVFSYTDIQSSINLAQAMNNRGVWPPDRCNRGDQCFRLVWVPFSVYDQKFIQDGGEGARSVSTFIPHIPLPEVNHAAMGTYLEALGTVRGARPSTFSIFGYASGVMFVEALGACPAAPTRSCLMESLRRMSNFTAGGLLGGTTPFRTTRVNFGEYGTYDWKWIFNRSIAMRVLDRGGQRDFHRIHPARDFFDDVNNVARGTRVGD